LQAETDLLRLFTQDTDSFLLACAGIIADQLKHHTARKITATVMKALLARKVRFPSLRTTQNSGIGMRSGLMYACKSNPSFSKP
jgi:hypothetical protein